MSQTSLKSIFEATKDDLSASLSGLTLPKDAAKAQEVITSFLNTVCDENNEYRQNLTQSEDYILQAALSMLNAQRDLVSAFDVTPKIKVESTSVSEGDVSTLAQERLSKTSSIPATSTFISVGGGAVIGKLLLGGWGAVFGAIAGTAIALYLSQQQSVQVAPLSSNPATQTCVPKVTITETPINSDLLISVVSQICDGLDNLIATFRAQIKRVVNKYESQDKPTIERDFRVLLEGIQSLIGYKRGHSSDEEKYLAKLQTRVEDLAELLDNYDLVAVDYTPEHAEWFEAIESNNSTQIKLVTPAIVKDNTLVLKGKIFTPKA